MALHIKKKPFMYRYFAFVNRLRTSDRIIFHTVLLAVLGSAIFLGLQVNAQFIRSVPTSGGTLVEGIIGTPRFVNPVLAITQPDHDIAALVYSGLMKIDESGNLINDLAKSIDVSDDGLTYHVTLRKGVHFHNGEEVKARDVAYTISLIQNPDLKSPLRGNWDGVQVQELGDYELNIVLEEAYAPFIENLTVGILPRDIWDELPTEQIPFSQHNTEPIGSGPYMIDSVQRNKSGLINSYNLKAFDDSRQNPNITNVVFKFYRGENEVLQALEDHQIDATPSLSTDSLGKVDTSQYNIIKSVLPRTFAVYFNQNKSAMLRDASVRKALQAAIDKQALVNQVLHGYGIPIDGPVPKGYLPVQSASSSSSTISNEAPEAILADDGWSKTDDGHWAKDVDGSTTQLTVILSTANTPLFDQISKFIHKAWGDLGVHVKVNQFEQTDLVQGVIRPRDYEALLFGADIGRSLDLYPFWHSSQKDDPGLNIVRYTNIDADAYLERMRTETDTQKKTEDIRSFEKLVAADTPAVFLFAPTFNYVIGKNVTVTPIEKLGKPSERFANIAQWHILSHALYPIFSEQK